MNNIIKLRLIKKTITYEKSFGSDTYDYIPPELENIAVGTVFPAIYAAYSDRADSVMLYLEDKKQWIEIKHKKYSYSTQLILNLFEPA